MQDKLEEDYRVKAKHYKQLGDQFLQNQDASKAAEEYQQAINALMELEPDLNDEDYSLLSHCWNARGDALKKGGYSQRPAAIESYKRALQAVHQVKHNQNQNYNHIFAIYRNLQTFCTPNSEKNNLYSLAMHIFNTAMYDLPQVFENQLAELEKTPVTQISMETYDDWLQLLKLIRDSWKPEYFAEQCPYKSYFCQKEVQDMIQEKIEQLQFRCSSLSNLIIRNENFYINLLLKVSLLENKVEALEKENKELKQCIEAQPTSKEQPSKGHSFF